MKDRIPLLILGAGIAGMGAAWKAKKEGLDFKIIEASSSAGGMLQSLKIDGHIFDQGPNSCVENDVYLDFLKFLEIEDQLIPASLKSKKRFLYQETGIAEVGGIKDIITANWISTKGKLRMFIEPFCRKGRAEDESVYDFLKRRIGEEAVTKIVDPVLGGVYAGNIQKLSALTVLEGMKLGEQNFGSLFRTFLSAPNPPRQITNLKGGFSTLSRAFELKFKEDCLLNSRVERITQVASGFDVVINGNIISCKNIVCALPAYVLEKVVLIDPLKKHLQKLSYSSLIVSFFTIQEKDLVIPEGFGILVPSKLNMGIKGILFTSDIFSGRVKNQERNMTVFHSESNNMRPVESELKKILGTEKVSLLAQKRWPKAIPQFEVGFQMWKSQLDKFVPEGIFLAGNYLGKVGVADVLKSGYDSTLNC
ncbi:MAG: Protoporphyrinogen oxidase [Owenweeksia sp. TMED14]|nr:MAG: Protoporphyrinogen oxidase [Owenweeksia sp. TMED14]|tara:strand:- start:738 stop:2000 length:1263 start_codon:yes stop_codon:yes gene_type:complete